MANYITILIITNVHFLTNFKGHCHAIWQLYEELEGVFASTEFQNENHFVNFTGATTFALATHVYTSMLRVVYINKFVAGHEYLFYRKYS